MRRFWQKPPVVSMEGNLSDPAVGNTPVKAAKNSLQGTIASNQTKKQPQTECLLILQRDIVISPVVYMSEFY